MPELHHQEGGAGGQDNSISNLASSFKDKMKFDKKHGSNENQPDQKKEVMLESGGKKKRPGGTSSKKSLPSVNMDHIQREIARAKEESSKEEGRQRLVVDPHLSGPWMHQPTETATHITIAR